jgi:hypothetical protein
MNGKILIIVVIVATLFSLYSWYTTKDYDAFDINSQNYAAAMAAADGPKRVAVEADPQRVVAPAGPSAPAQAPSPSAPAVIMPAETPFDPQEQTYESADHPDRLRHPERSFGPGLVNDNTGTAVASGIASSAQQVTQNAYQTFGPEFATNGGSFLDNGVTANDSDMPLSYSSI